MPRQTQATLQPFPGSASGPGLVVRRQRMGKAYQETVPIGSLFPATTADSPLAGLEAHREKASHSKAC